MEQVNDKELLEKNWRSDLGFAAYYCYKCKDERMNVAIFEKLVEVDAKLGITPAEQLFDCLEYTARLDVIKV